MSFLWILRCIQPERPALHARYPFQRRAFSTQFRVVRFSRLIGNSDSTGSTSRLASGQKCRESWYKRHRRRKWPHPCHFGKTASDYRFLPQTHETPFSLEWRFASLRWSLASQQIVAGGYIHRAFSQAFSTGLPLRWRLLLPSVCFFAGWPDYFPAAGTSLALLHIAISMPFLLAFKVNGLHSAATVNRFDSRNTEHSNFKKQ